MKFLTKLMVATCLTFSGFCGVSAVQAHALDKYEAAARFDSISHDSCGNGTTWVCAVRYGSNCTWISHNYFFCERYWVETQYGIRNQEQRGYGHLAPYPYVAGAWYSPDYRVQNIG
jgi:hypothetical protein